MAKLATLAPGAAVVELVVELAAPARARKTLQFNASHTVADVVAHVAA